MSRKKTTRIRPEIWGFIALLLIANFSLTAGRVSEAFIFFRADFFAGEWWRILTYPFVHVSAYHLLLDAGAFILLYQGLLTRATCTRLLYVAACSAGSLGASLLLSPMSGGLCGLSGIAHGLMAITGLELMHSPDRPLQKAGLICLVITLIKSIFEVVTGEVAFSFLHLGSVGSPITVCHLGGAIGGIVAYSILKRRSEYSKGVLHETH